MSTTSTAMPTSSSKATAIAPAACRRRSPGAGGAVPLPSPASTGLRESSVCGVEGGSAGISLLSLGSPQPAIVAGADGVVDKGLPARDLFEAIRRVHGGEPAFPPVLPAHLRVAAAALQERDLPILGMLIEQTPLPDIAAVLRSDVAIVRRRTRRMLEDLLVSVSDGHRRPSVRNGANPPAA
jgi:hypothetical protein